MLEDHILKTHLFSSVFVLLQEGAIGNSTEHDFKVDMLREM